MCAGAGGANVLIRPVDVLVLSCVQLVLITAVVMTLHPRAGHEVPAGSRAIFKGITASVVLLQTPTSTPRHIMSSNSPITFVNGAQGPSGQK